MRNARKGRRALACHALPGTEQLIFGVGGGLVELRYAGTGFLLVRRQVYSDFQQRLGLPVCNQRFERTTIPFFQPLVIPDGEGHWYLPEDFAFCERARQRGYKIMADTTIRLWHHGSYGYSWEDAGISAARCDTFNYDVE